MSTVAARRHPSPSPEWRLRLASVAASLGLFFVLLVYVTAFWGKAGLLLTAPLDTWHHVFIRALMRWSAGARQFLQNPENAALYWLLETYIVGLGLPAALLALVGRRTPADFGLRRLDEHGWRWALVGVVLSVPVGLWITALVPRRGNELIYMVNILCMLPEHFLICGIGVASLLPRRRLPDCCDTNTSGEQRAGVSFEAAPAILGSTFLFVLAHVGAQPLELAFSLPMGLFCAYLTWRTASIWPALFSHWTLNLAPLGLRYVF